MRSSSVTLAAIGALLALTVAAPAANADLASLKASCSTNTPAPGYSYRFCDDGLPPSGGTTPNPSGTAAIEVPARYQATAGDDWTGLPPSANDASMPGADPQGNIALDVDVSIPTTPAPSGGYPLIAMMHGCCSGNKTSWEAPNFDAAGEKWHYNNAWFASRGYVVITYTARGFVSGESSGNRGSTGETQLDSRRFEINDFQHLAGQLADDPFFNVNPQKILTTGGSYGGGFSWLAFTDPIWDSLAGTDMKLAAVAPKYGWTDLVYSLVPTGRHFQTPSNLPAFNGSDSTTPLGFPKKSIVAALYDSGKTGIPPGSPHATFSNEVDQAFLCLQSTDPYETNPLCASTISQTLPSFINDRSAYYQNAFFANVASNPSYRTPVFNAATFTDPLFTPVENLRMSNRLQSLVPNYPIQQYFGDYQHFVQNKAKEWGDICGANRHVCTFADYPGGNLNADPTGLQRTGATTRLNRFIDHYAQPPGNSSEPQPAFNVTASLQICPQNAGSQPADEPGPTFTAGSFLGLTNGTFEVDLAGSQTTVNNAEPNPHAANSDPVFNFAANGGRCPVETQPAGPGVATYDSLPLSRQQTMIGATSVTIDYSTLSPSDQGLQLNSRLYDVFPNGQAVMVDRGVRRITNRNGPVTYQLHGNGWRFAAGHKIRIEVAQDDDPFIRASSISSSMSINHVHLSIPVRDSFAAPQSASFLRGSLVPVARQCGTAGNPADGSHSPPLGTPSCSPPVALGVAHLGAQASGFAQMTVVPGEPSTTANEADVVYAVNASDLRDGSRTGPDYDPNPSGADITLVNRLRITDFQNGPDGNDAGTTTDLDFAVPVTCAASGGPDGSNCNANTTANAVMPGAIVEGRRMNVQVFRSRLLDSGSNDVRGDGDDQLFAVQGVYIP